MKRYFVEIKRGKKVLGFYVYAYNRTQIRDMFGLEYEIITLDLTE